MVYNKIYAQIGEERHITIDPINYQYDIKQILVIQGETVPDYYEADVCNVGDTATLTMVGTAADGVEIPDKFLLDGRNVLVYIVIPGSGGDVQTRYDITIPVDERAEREDIDPSEAEQQQIDSLINALNSGVGRAEEAATAAEESATDAEGSAGEAEDHAADAEAWAVGQRAGEDVPDTDPTYHNNSKYYAGRAKAAAAEAGQHEASWESWVRRAESAADDAEGSARDAAGSKADAEAAAQTAAQKATEAGNSAAAAAGSAASARQTVDGAIGAINTAKEGALTAIGSAGSNAVGAANQAGTTQTERVTTEGNTQVNRVQEKGDEVLDSIPQDYSDLADDVADLSRQLSDLDSAFLTNATAVNVSAITSGDLNDYLTPGNYKITATSIATAVANTPVNEAGRIVVLSTVNNNNHLQFYITNAGNIHLRSHNALGWSDWVYLANNENIASIYRSPTFTGVPTAPTATSGTVSKQIATTEFVAGAVNALGKPIATDANAVKQILAGEDLNDYTTAGNYRIASSGTASQVSNTPVNEGARIVVMSVAGAASQIQFYITNAGIVYYRSHNASGWSDWEYFANNGHIEDVYNSPTFTGTPKAPTAPGGTSTTQIATTQFVTAAINALGIPISTSAGSMTQISANSDLNDYTNVGNYRIGTSSTAVTISNIPINDAGRLIVSHLGAPSTLIQIYIANSASFYVRRYNASGWGAWFELVQNDAEYKGLFTSIDRMNTASQGLYSFIKVLESMGIYNVRFANAPVPIGLQNYVLGYAGNTQNVHPKVLYFASKFGGHYYWMAYTPYPYGRSQYENPCIAYSDDGYYWTNIDGNPIDDPQGVGYNSDTHLVYRSDTNTLECWYRYVSESEPRYETIYRQISTDGVTWSAKETVFQSTTAGATHYLSPAVEWDGSKYQIWVVDGAEIVYYEAAPTNITAWTRIRSYSIPFTDDGESSSPWHLDVIKDNGTYIMLVICMVNNSPRSKWSLFITTSTDNISYSTPTKVIEGALDSWDMYMYRSSIVKVGNSYRIYYSAMDGEDVCGIGIAESTSLANFIGKLVL